MVLAPGIILFAWEWSCAEELYNRGNILDGYTADYFYFVQDPSDDRQGIFKLPKDLRVFVRSRFYSPCQIYILVSMGIAVKRLQLSLLLAVFVIITSVLLKTFLPFYLFLHCIIGPS